MKRLLVVYNICGLSGFQNFIYYEDALKSILQQRGFEEGELTVAVSSCCSNDHTIRNLTHNFASHVHFNWIGENLPLTVTFNHTVNECVRHLGEFDAYLYLDSGINLWDPSGRWDSLRSYWDAYLSEPSCAIMAGFPSNDDGSSWWGIHYPADSIYTYQIGQTTNLHCQIYSEEFRKAYGKLHCDIFANDTSESVTSYLTAAIGKRFMMTNKIQVFHNAHLDGASFGWRGGEGIRKRLFVTEKTMDERYLEGYEFGFGYEECNGNEAWTHDKDCFDEAGNPKYKEELYQFLKRELFLTREQFDYSTIASHFVEKGK